MRVVQTRTRTSEGATLTWTSDVASRGSTVMALPGTAEGSALPVAAAVWVVGVPQATVDLRMLVVSAADGTALGTSGQHDFRNVDGFCPHGSLEPLRAVGLRVEATSVRHRKELQQRFPGSARWWWLLTFPYALVPLALVPLLLAVLVLALL